MHKINFRKRRRPKNTTQTVFWDQNVFSPNLRKTDDENLWRSLGISIPKQTSYDEPNMYGMLDDAA